MKPTLKTALCSVSFVAVGAFAQTSTLTQIQVNSGFGNPLYDFTTFYESWHTPGHGTRYHILGYQYNIDVLLSSYGLSASHLSYGITSIDDGYGDTITIPVVHLGDRQCVAVVQLLSNARETKKWRAKEHHKLHANMNFPVPFVVATFYGGEDSNGKKYGGQWMHTGIVFQYDTNGVWILEQNWDGSGPNPVGRLAMRYMTYSGSYQNNADNYYVVHQLP